MMMLLLRGHLFQWYLRVQVTSIVVRLPHQVMEEEIVGSLGTAFYIVAIILAVLAAIPPVPYTGSLLALSLGFFEAAHAIS